MKRKGLSLVLVILILAALPVTCIARMSLVQDQAGLMSADQQAMRLGLRGDGGDAAPERPGDDAGDHASRPERAQSASSATGTGRSALSP